jgi:hypothetical protein
MHACNAARQPGGGIHPSLGHPSLGDCRCCKHRRLGGIHPIRRWASIAGASISWGSAAAAALPPQRGTAGKQQQQQRRARGDAPGSLARGAAPSQRHQEALLVGPPPHDAAALEPAWGGVRQCGVGRGGGGGGRGQRVGSSGAPLPSQPAPAGAPTSPPCPTAAAAPTSGRARVGRGYRPDAPTGRAARVAAAATAAGPTMRA